MISKFCVRLYYGGLWEANQYISFKNNAALLYFILGTAEVHIFSWTTIVKTKPEFTDLLANDIIDWTCVWVLIYTNRNQITCQTHPKETSKNPDIFDSIEKFWLQFTSGPEIIVLNCSLHLVVPNYIGIFPVHLRCLWYSQIFQQEVGFSCVFCNWLEELTLLLVLIHDPGNS